MPPFARGVIIGCLLHFLQVPALAVLALLLMPVLGTVAALVVYLPMFIGVIQLVYMVPAIRAGIRRGERGYVSGLCCAGVLLSISIIAVFVVLEWRRPIP